MSHSKAAAHTALAPASPGITAITGSERPIGRYDFEGGAYVRIAAFGDVDTEEALDMVETLLQLKRKELERASKRSNVPAPSPVVDETDELKGL